MNSSSINLSTARSKAAPLVRTAMLLMAHRGDILQAEQAAGRSFPASPEVAQYLKAAISAGSTEDPAWAAPLAAHAAVVSGFVDVLRAATLVGKLQGSLRPVPFGVRVLPQVTGSQARFVAEGRPAPLTAMGFDAAAPLGWTKLQAIIAFASELTRTWTQASEDHVRNDMVAGVAAGMDRAFIDPTVGAASDPPSITYGITPRPSSGSTVDAITSDLKALMSEQLGFGNDLSTSVWIMSPRSALHISTLRDAAGGLAFPGASVLGGSLLGLPLLVSGAVALAGSPTDSYVVLLNPRRVLLADDGLATISVSEHAALQMQDAPSPGGQALQSLWQLGLSALKISRYVCWQRASDDAVSLLGDVQY